VASDQRLIGMDLIELRALAFGGDPAVAERAGQRLSRAAAALEQVSASLERAAGQVGLGWTGQAAEAARSGIAGHAQWARTAAARAAAAGGSASAQAASANHVRANMPDPGVGSAALGAGGSPVATDSAHVNPVSTDLARAEEAQRNARLRAVELLEGHAAESQAQRVTGALGAPPGGAAGSAGTAAGRSGAATSRAATSRAATSRAATSRAATSRASAGRGGAQGPAPQPSRIAGPSVAGGPGSPTRPPSGDRRMTVAYRPGAAGAAGATAGAAARGGPSTTLRTGPRPTAVGHEVRLPVGGVEPGKVAAGTGSDLGTRRGGPVRTGPAAARDGVPVPDPVPGAGRHARGAEVALPARHGSGVGSLTTEQQQAGQGGFDARAGHRAREAPEAGGMGAPIGGPVGATGSAPLHPTHRRLGFLIDEDCAFDEDRAFDEDCTVDEDRAEGRWVSPPVIGA
jgi:hypothetical protein